MGRGCEKAKQGMYADSQIEERERLSKSAKIEGSGVAGVRGDGRGR